MLRKIQKFIYDLPNWAYLLFFAIVSFLIICGLWYTLARIVIMAYQHVGLLSCP